MRLLSAFAVFAFALGLGSTWMDIHGLWIAPTPAMGPEKWDKLLILVVWLIGGAAVAQWLMPPRPSDFGGGFLGHFAAAIGAVLALSWLGHILDRAQSETPPALGEMAITMLRFLFFAFAVVAISRWMMMLHKKRAQAARNRLAAGGPFSVYLRPFELDAVMERWSRTPWYEVIGIQLQRTHSIEEALAELVDRHCPLVAVGDSVVGARKMHVSDEAWRAEVEALLRDAAIVFFIPGPSPGALWEAERLADPDVYRLQKTFWLMPPKSEFTPSFDISEFWERTRAAAAERGITLPPYQKSGGVYVGRQYYLEKEQRYVVELHAAPDAEPGFLAAYLHSMTAPWEDRPTADFLAPLRAALQRPFDPCQHYLRAILDPVARGAETGPYGLPRARTPPSAPSASD